MLVPLGPLAVKVTSPVPPVAVTVIVSPANEALGGVSGMVPLGLICRNFAASSVKASMAVGAYLRLLFLPVKVSVLAYVFHAAICGVVMFLYACEALVRFDRTATWAGVLGLVPFTRMRTVVPPPFAF